MIMETNAPAPTYLDRLLTEKIQLVKRLTRLNEYIEGHGLASVSFVNLPQMEQRLLLNQQAAMLDYLQALSARLALTGQ